MGQAVDITRVSAIVGYQLDKGFFNENSPNLPISIAIVGEANHANQTDLVTTGTEITSAKQAGELYGFGSPIHLAMRILRPLGGGGVGGIKTVVYAQAEAVGATPRMVTITPSGTATGNGTHTVLIGGRRNVDGKTYNITIATGDTTADITAKIQDAINNVLSAPVAASSTDYEATLTTKWYGATAQELDVYVDTNGDDLGISYLVTEDSAAAGTPDVDAALAQFGNTWHNMVLNLYGTQTDVCAALTSFNGRPDPTTPTGRYAGVVFKPFVALTGTTAENPSAFADARLNDCTIALCPAPLSPGFQFEAAANFAALAASIAQNTPNLDVQDKLLPDMPVPYDGNGIGAMADYENRDLYVQKGCSTVDFVGNQYQIKDFVTTYHPVGEVPPQYRYVRNLYLDYNVRYTYMLLEAVNVLGHSIALDNQVVNAANVVKPKQWKQILFAMFESLGQRGLIVDVQFSKNNCTVAIDANNPDRFNTLFKYKRSGFMRIASTNATAGFYFGTLTV